VCIKLECAWSYIPAVRVKGQPKNSHAGHFLEEGFFWGAQVAERKTTETLALSITLFEIFSGGSLPYPGMVWDRSFVEILESGFKNSKPEFSSDHE